MFSNHQKVQLTVRSNCSPRSFGECVDTLTTLDEISNDPLEVCSVQGICRLFGSSIGMAASTSGGAFAEIAFWYGKDFTGILIGTALIGIPFIGTAFARSSFGLGNNVC